jgi:CPA2 family monovalent cation:H+ antiporter-2
LEELSFGRDIVIVLAAATAGGFLAHRLKLPVILGYLAAGIAIGPNGFSVVQHLETVDALATIGVVLLLFALGLEFSLHDLLRLGKIAVLGGIAQILFTAALALVLGRFLGYQLLPTILFGFLIALSSTTIVLKTLTERGELDTGHGRIMTGILLVQDLAVVPLIVIIPAIGGGNGNIWLPLGIAVLKAILIVGIMLALGLWGLPWLLKRVAATRSRELFMLMVFSLSLAAALGTYVFGLSAALGAFIAGLVVSESSFARQAFADIIPLRNVFLALFFVSLGMLFSPQFVAGNVLLVIIVVIGIILVKLLVCFLISWAAGFDPKTVIFVSLGLIQIGEFSFILAQMGASNGLIPLELYDLILASALFTMIITPFAFSLAGGIYRHFGQSPVMNWLTRQRRFALMEREKLELVGHAVICGYGRIGENLTRVLKIRNFHFVVIDLDPLVIARLQSEGHHAIYGDATSPEILAHTNLEKSRVLIITYNDLISTELTARNARNINPHQDIVARVSQDRDAELLRGMGVSELVLPEFEASLEITRHTLHRFGLTTIEIQYILSGLRGKGQSLEEK